MNSGLPAINRKIGLGNVSQFKVGPDERDTEDREGDDRGRLSESQNNVFPSKQHQHVNQSLKSLKPVFNGSTLKTASDYSMQSLNIGKKLPNLGIHLKGKDHYEPSFKVVSKPAITKTVNETFLEYYFQSNAGFSDGRTKTNQDAVYVNVEVQGSSNCSLFAVFDGHGMQGHKVSDFLKRILTGMLAIDNHRVFQQQVQSLRRVSG